MQQKEGKKERRKGLKRRPFDFARKTNRDCAQDKQGDGKEKKNYNHLDGNNLSPFEGG